MLQASARQLEQHAGITLCAEQAHLYLRIGTHAVFQVQGETLYATVTTGQVGGQIGCQPTQREQQRLMGLHLEIQLDTGIEHIRGRIEIQRQRALAQQGIEMAQHIGRKPPGQAVTRQSQ